MTAKLAMGYIDDELSQLETSYVDLLLFHHRCNTSAETAEVWSAFEDAKRQGKARHIGVSNFNTHNLKTLAKTAQEPIEVLEAHFGVGIFDFEVVEFANTHGIHPVSFSSLSPTSTDLHGLHPTITKVSAAHNITPEQVMYAYVAAKNITVLSSFDPAHPKWLADDIAIFGVTLTSDEMTELDRVTPGKRTCPDCYTFECQACANALESLNCPVGPRHGGFIWGRSNPQAEECMACGALPANAERIAGACGSLSEGESLETMVPKACGI